MTIAVKRAYVEPGEGDGSRLLVDRFWPRGRSKEVLQLEAWLREAAPSPELCKWFNHEPEKWAEFKRRYFAELDRRTEVVLDLLARVKAGPVTLVYGAHDERHNNAVALREYLEDLRR